jgi:drug/metabolite transporter (DMT)-like permease
MNFSLVLSVIFCVLGMSIGQLLFKQAAMSLPSLALRDLLQSGWFLLSIALYGVTMLGWVWILRQAPLYLAYPFMGLAFLIVPVLAWLFLGEPLHWRTLAGGALIMAGVALASTS